MVLESAAPLAPKGRHSYGFGADAHSAPRSAGRHTAMTIATRVPLTMRAPVLSSRARTCRNIRRLRNLCTTRAFPVLPMRWWVVAARAVEWRIGAQVEGARPKHSIGARDEVGAVAVGFAISHFPMRELAQSRWSLGRR